MPTMDEFLGTQQQGSVSQDDFFNSSLDSNKKNNTGGFGDFKVIEEPKMKTKSDEKKESFMSRALSGFAEKSGKALEFGTKVTGIKSGIELAAPAAEGFSYLATFLTGDKKERQRILDNPMGKIQKKAVEEGTLEGVKQVGGQALQTGAEAMPFATGGLGSGLTGLAKEGPKLTNFANSFVGRSAEIAFADSVGKGIEEGDEASKILKDSSINSLFAAGTSYLLGSAVNKLVGGLKEKSTKLVGRGLETPARNIQKDIEAGRKTINRKIVEEGYRGTEEKIRQTAVANKKKYGEAINDAIKKAEKKGVISIVNGKPVTISNKILKKDVVKGVEELFDKNVTLDDSQMKMIIRQIDKIPENMSISQANNYKRQFAKLVPDNAWNNTASQEDTFRAEIFKTISGGFRKNIEKAVPKIKKLNEKWAIANDVLSLVGKKLSKAEGAPGLSESIGGGPFTAAIRTATKPFTSTVSRTTRAQLYEVLRKSGNKELIRELGKLLIVKGE